MDCSGSEGLGCRVGATLERWSGRDKETAHAYSGSSRPPRVGPGEAMRPVGQHLIRKHGPSPGWIVTTCSVEGSLEVQFMPFPGIC